MIADEEVLPCDEFAHAWSAIKISQDLRSRLVAQVLLALQLRKHFQFDAMPLHGFILLSGPPGTGKTTLARGLANEVARALGGKGALFLQVDPHALASSNLGKSQKEVTRLFHEVIPARATHRPCIVLLDEVETLAGDRHRMSLEANPIDVHRATDAALAGLDLLSRKHKNVVVLATTNFPKAVDRALLSRADWIVDVGVPNADARAEIINATWDQLAQKWPKVAALTAHTPAFVEASEGMDGRRLKKAILAAAATNVDTARDLNNLKPEHVLAALKALLATTKDV